VRAVEFGPARRDPWAGNVARVVVRRLCAACAAAEAIDVADVPVDEVLVIQPAEAGR
jgi:hypothetical protein